MIKVYQTDGVSQEFTASTVGLKQERHLTENMQACVY
jgi:hypothetical protein